MSVLYVHFNFLNETAAWTQKMLPIFIIIVYLTQSHVPEFLIILEEICQLTP